VANAVNDPDILQNAIEWLRNPKFNDEYRNLGLRCLEERFGADVLQQVPAYAGVIPESDDNILPF
jgi:hypothetical protein